MDHKGDFGSTSQSKSSRKNFTAEKSVNPAPGLEPAEPKRRANPGAKATGGPFYHNGLFGNSLMKDRKGMIPVISSHNNLPYLLHGRQSSSSQMTHDMLSKSPDKHPEEKQEVPTTETFRGFEGSGEYAMSPVCTSVTTALKNALLEKTDRKTPSPVTLGTTSGRAAELLEHLRSRLEYTPPSGEGVLKTTSPITSPKRKQTSTHIPRTPTSLNKLCGQAGNFFQNRLEQLAKDAPKDALAAARIDRLLKAVGYYD